MEKTWFWRENSNFQIEVNNQLTKSKQSADKKVNKQLTKVNKTALKKELWQKCRGKPRIQLTKVNNQLTKK